MTDISSYELRYLEVYWRGLEIRAGIFPYEERFNPYHDEKGRFCSAPSKASAKSLTKKSKGCRMTIREIVRVSHQIATDFPELEADGTVYPYYCGNYTYKFRVIEFGSYRFISKTKIK